MSTITQASELAGQQAVELGELLASTVVSVAAAQEGLDRHATPRLDAMERGGAGAVVDRDQPVIHQREHVVDVCL